MSKKASPTAVYTVRLPEHLRNMLKSRARELDVAPATLVRRWVEAGVRTRSRHAAEPAAGYASTDQRAVIGSALAALTPQLARACARHHVQRLTLFGSFASGDARTDSDLDLCVDFGPLSPADHADAYFGLWEDLKKIFERDVDLIERGAVGNAIVRASLEKTEIDLYAA